MISMRRRAAWVGLLVALGGCTEQVVLHDVVDADVADGAPPAVDSGENRDRYRWEMDAGCSSFPITLLPQSAQLMILLDRSSAMQGDFPGSSSRQSAVQDALLASIDTYQSRIKFGFEEFPGDPGRKSNNCMHQSCCAGAVSVPPGLNQGPLMSGALQCSEQQVCQFSSSDSPSYDALSKVRDYYRSRSGFDTDDRYVLLVTASDPSCSSESGTMDSCGMATNAATDLGNMGVTVVVFSVGYQPDSNPKSCLSSLSKVGSSNATMPGNAPRLYAPTSFATLSKDISDLFDAIAKANCTFSTNNPGPEGVLPKVWVGFTQVQQGGPDGWSFNDPGHTQIALSGSACDLYLSQVGAKVTVYWCSTCSSPGVCSP